MKAAWSVVLGLVAVFALSAVARAADAGKEVTLKGTITCAKCDLKVADKCATVIKFKEGDKDVVYYLDAKSHGANHKTICQGAKPGSVTGVVSDKDGKKIITASKVDFQ